MFKTTFSASDRPDRCIFWNPYKVCSMPASLFLYLLPLFAISVDKLELVFDRQGPADVFTGHLSTEPSAVVFESAVELSFAVAGLAPTCFEVQLLGATVDRTEQQ